MNLFARLKQLSTYVKSLLALLVLVFTLPVTPLAETADHRYLVYVIAASTIFKEFDC